MRIAFNALFLQNPNTGSGQYARHLLLALRSVAPELDITLLGAPPPFAGRGLLAPQAGSRTENVTKLLWEQAAVPLLAGRLKADLLHVPYWAPPLVLATPVVTTIHDVIPALLPDYAGGSLVQAYTRLVTLTARQSRRVIVDSECSARDLVRLLGVPTSRVDVVPLAADPALQPVDRAVAREECERRWGLDTPFLLYAGGNDIRKNVPALLHAWSIAAPRLLGHAFVLAGAMPSRPPFFPDLRRLAAELQLHRLRFLGDYKEEDKRLLLAACDAFCWPSRYEGFGLPPLEAMQVGAPVICSNASSMPEVVGDAARLFAPDDVAGLAAAMVAVGGNGTSQSMLREAGLARSAQFTWERTAALTVAAYRRALDR